MAVSWTIGIARFACATRLWNQAGWFGRPSFEAKRPGRVVENAA